MNKRKHANEKTSLPKRSKGPAQPGSRRVFTVVKVSLATVLKQQGLVQKAAFDNYVWDGNRLLVEAWLLANLYVSTRIQQNQRLPELDQVFCYQCLRQVRPVSPRRTHCNAGRLGPTTAC